ncbi:MAG: DUF3102 domain-containing protein [Phycisphaerae bacterium]|nr:DUF3102 domain-containing protein [Phycisphaerae bacterium]
MEAIERNRADEITLLHGEIGGLLKTSLDKAIRIGELLREQKASLKHGEFIPWIEANLPFTDRTARNYMRLNENRGLLKTENVSDLRSAYALLASPAQEPEAKNEHLAAEIAEGHYITKQIISCAQGRFAEIDNIQDSDEALLACKEVVELLRGAVQDSAEYLLYTESHLGKLLSEHNSIDNEEYRITPVDLEFKVEMGLFEWALFYLFIEHIAVGCNILGLSFERLIDSEKWWLGSWYNYGERHFGKKAYDEAKKVMNEWGPHLHTREAFEAHLAQLVAEWRRARPAGVPEEAIEEHFTKIVNKIENRTDLSFAEAVEKHLTLLGEPTT